MLIQRQRATAPNPLRGLINTHPVMGGLLHAARGRVHTSCWRVATTARYTHAAVRHSRPGFRALWERHTTGLAGAEGGIVQADPGQAASEGLPFTDAAGGKRSTALHTLPGGKGVHSGWQKARVTLHCCCQVLFGSLSGLSLLSLWDASVGIPLEDSPQDCFCAKGYAKLRATDSGLRCVQPVSITW